jgi:dTDP-4-amino-4,6-dideoxygalactose transaminase
MEPYRSFYPHAGLLLPETERLVTRVLSLPSGTALSTGDVRRLGALIRLIAANAPEVRNRLEEVEGEA